MSDEREKRAETDEPELESDEVEAHKHAHWANEEPSAEEGDDDVEAHMHLKRHDRF